MHVAICSTASIILVYSTAVYIYIYLRSSIARKLAAFTPTASTKHAFAVHPHAPSPPPPLYNNPGDRTVIKPRLTHCYTTAECYSSCAAFFFFFYVSTAKEQREGEDNKNTSHARAFSATRAIPVQPWYTGNTRCIIQTVVLTAVSIVSYAVRPSRPKVNDAFF